MRSRTLMSCACISTVLTAACFSQCEVGWKQGDGIAGVHASYVLAQTKWDPDGNGPQSARLVAGGYMDLAGDSDVNNIAQWNPATNQWSALGEGLSGPLSQVQTIASSSSGQLIAGGLFSQSRGAFVNNIAQWVGDEWLPLGDGIQGGYVNAITFADNGDVVAGGVFSVAGTQVVSNIARYTEDGSWQPLAEGTDLDVVCLVTLPTGDIVAGGYFTTAGTVTAHGVARWDGTEWHPMSTVEGTSVTSLVVMPNGDLIGSGTFFDVETETSLAIAKWTGSEWMPVGGGIDGAAASLTVASNGDLIAGGFFYTADGLPANNIARWDGTAWTALGGGTDSWIASVETLPNGEVVAGGSFLIAGGKWIPAIARWSGSDWFPLGSGMTQPVNTLALHPNGNIIAGGLFASAGDEPNVNGIAQWDGSDWSPLGTGMMFENGWATVHSVAVLQNGEVVAGGIFTSAGGTPANNIALWNGSAWSSLGDGLDGPVYAVAVTQMGDIIAGGQFMMAGSEVVNNIAIWDGTTWNALGTGIGEYEHPEFGAVPGVVESIAVLPDGDVVVGGFLGNAGGIAVNSIARWDGTEWHALGSGIGTPAVSHIYDLSVQFNGDLIAVGNFGLAGGNVVHNVARWDGTSWSDIGGGTNARVFAITTLANGDIVVGGRFDQAGGNEASRIARWDGSTWSPIGDAGFGAGTYDSNFPHGVFALASTLEGDIVAGGKFTKVNGPFGVTSAYFAVYEQCLDQVICNDIDINNDGSMFDPQDIEAFLSVYSEGPCIPEAATCDDIDFNNDTSLFDPCDIDSFLLMYSEGPCTPCGT